MVLRPQLRRLPPLARRDAQIQELRREIRRLERRLEARQRQVDRLRAAPPPPPPYPPRKPSWHVRVMEQQRVQRAIGTDPGYADHPRHNLFLKLHNYEVARSHGVSTPQVLGVWPSPAEIDWAALPEEFVLKSNGGSTSRGVLPLRRTATGFEMLDGTRHFTADEIVEHYATARRVRAPFFAETLLPGSHEQLPDDIKIYTYYGEVAFALLRRMPVHGDTSRSRVRFLGADGTDLGELRHNRAPDDSVAAPRHYALMTGIASVLSLAVPLPFIRVDLYDTPGGVVLGELTPLPGDSDTFLPQWDRRLGQLYDRAEARLQLDLARGRPFRVLHGPHDRSPQRPMPATTVVPDLPAGLPHR